MFESVKIPILLAQLRANQWKSQEEIEAIQEERFRQLVSYAREHVQYYRGSLKATDGVPIEKLPLVRKSELMARTDDFLSDGFRKNGLIKLHTSGSTGTPMPVYHAPSESSYGPAFELHQLLEAGVRPTDLQVSIVHKPGAEHLLQRLGLFRRSYLPIQERELTNLLALERMGADALLCYPSYLVSLSNENISSGTDLRMGRIFSSTEMLSDQARGLISRSFGCPVYDMYGAMETSWIAWQCEEGSMHVFSDNMIVEVVDEGGMPVKRGEYGNLVITTLWKRSMPLIRYSLGDRAALGERCECGRGFHVIRSMEGRGDDFLRLPSGRLLSPRSINVLDDLTDIRNYQIIQEEADLFLIRLVPAGDSLPDCTKAEIRKRITEGCGGEQVAVEFEEVGEIRRGGRGKIRTVISKVARGKMP